jgi:hypothetical protein
MHRVLEPLVEPRLVIATAEELADVHQALGRGEMDDRHRQQLAAYVRGAVGGMLRTAFDDEVVRIPALPAKLMPFEDGQVLSVAHDPEFVASRQTLKSTLPAFYGEPIPEEAWHDDTIAEGVVVAHSEGGPVADNSLTRLQNELNESGGEPILGDRILIGSQIQIRQTPPFEATQSPEAA